MIKRLYSTVVAFLLIYVILNCVQQLNAKNDCSADAMQTTLYQLMPCCLLTALKATDDYAIRSNCTKELKLNAVEDNKNMPYIPNAACVTDCMYIKRKYFIDNDYPEAGLHFENIENFLELNVPEPKEIAVNFMLSVYQQCLKIVKDLKTTESPCNQNAFKIDLCLSFFTASNCPREFFAFTKNCLYYKRVRQNCLKQIYG